MHGADIVAAIALGARAALVGPRVPVRADGRRRTGVAKSVQILTGEMVRTMQLLGVNSVDELRPSHVRLRPNGWTLPRLRDRGNGCMVRGMGLMDKAKELLGQHDDKVDQGIDKAGPDGPEKYGHRTRSTKAPSTSSA